MLRALEDAEMKLGQKLQKLRAGRSYAEVARAAKCSAPTIRDIEAGRTTDPSLFLIARLGAYHSVSLDWLSDDTQGWPPPPADSGQQVADTVKAALNRAGIIGELSQAERELLAVFRSLDTAGRREVLGFCSGISRRRVDTVSDEAAAQERVEARLGRDIQDAARTGGQGSASLAKHA